jgi:putative SOS response-associated peptidase YedK
MCYDIKTKLETQLKRAKRQNNQAWMEELKQKLAPYWQDTLFHASGFMHPTLLIYTNENLFEPLPAVWGLIPHWVKDEQQKLQLWNKTINARGETIFEKPSFRQAAMEKRCLIYLDGFYEHHHFKGKTYPFFVFRSDEKPMLVAGLWSVWGNKTSGKQESTFTIVTTKANGLMTKIHNNPKLPEARMPVLLEEEDAEDWLQADVEKSELPSLKKLIKPFQDGRLQAYPVRPLRGKSALGNVPEAAEKFEYEELEWEK